jgi:hypothetical protein
VEGTVAVTAPIRRSLPLDTPRGQRLGELQFEFAAAAEWTAHQESLAIRATQLVVDHLDLLAARFRADEETERLIFVEALAASLGETRSLEEAMDLVLSYVCDYAGWPYAEAWIPDEGGETLRRVRSCVRSDDLVAFDAAGADLTFQSGTGIPGKAWAIREAFLEPDFRPCARYPRADLANACGLTTGLAIPVRGTSDLLAVVCFYHRNVSQVSPELLRFVSVVIGQLSGPVARARRRDPAGDGARASRPLRLARRLRGDHRRARAHRLLQRLLVPPALRRTPARRREQRRAPQDASRHGGDVRELGAEAPALACVHTSRAMSCMRR